MWRRRRAKPDLAARDPGDRVFILEDPTTGAKTYIEVPAGDVDAFRRHLEARGAEES